MIETRSMTVVVVDSSDMTKNRCLSGSMAHYSFAVELETKKMESMSFVVDAELQSMLM